jgi:hypothetical protein
MTITTTDQRRTWLLTKLLVGEITAAEAAAVIGVPERQVRRLKRPFQWDGPAALAHGNRGRASPRRLRDETRARILELAGDRYAGVSDCHLAELPPSVLLCPLRRCTVRAPSITWT